MALIQAASCSTCVDTGGADDLAPLFGLCGDEPGKVGRRARKGIQTQFRKLGLERLIGECRIHVLI